MTIMVFLFGASMFERSLETHGQSPMFFFGNGVLCGPPMPNYHRAAAMHHCSNNQVFGKLQTPSLLAKSIFDCSGDLYPVSRCAGAGNWHSMGTISAGGGHGLI